MDVPFGPWEPDLGELARPGNIVDGTGLAPHADGWGPMPGLYTYPTADALPDQCIGVASIQTETGAWALFAAAADKIFRAGNDGALTEVASGYTPTPGDDWSFAQFGSKLLHTNATDGLNAYDVELNVLDGAIAAASKPRVIFVVANQVVGLDCLDSNSERNNKLIKTSAFSDHTNWTTNGADYQPLEDGGALVAGGALSDTAALILQERALRLMDYSAAGNGAYFALKPISMVTGSIGTRSVAFADGMAFFVATDGFYSFSLAGGLKNIGIERVNRWWSNIVDQGNLPLAQASIDPLRKIVWWRFKRASDTSTEITSVILGYAWTLDRWIPPLTVDTAYIFAIGSPSWTLDSMDGFGPLDGIDIPLDSRFWDGGQPLFAAFDGNRKLSIFDGDAMAASITSATNNSPVSEMISRATPIDDAALGTLTLGTKDALSDAITWRTPAAKGRAERVPLRGRGMNIAFRRDIPAGAAWTYARGVDYVVGASGGPT